MADKAQNPLACPVKENDEDEDEWMDRDLHIAYLCANLKGFHKSYSEFTQNHISGLYFVVCALDILNALDKAPFTRKEIIEWVYKFQVPVLPGDTTHANCYGFRGGLHLPFTKDGSTELNHNDMAHIANTYCALAVLTICGDDLSRVNKKAIATALKSYQNPATGSFQCLPCEIGQAETDVRFVYCACCISVLLNDWSGVDTEKAIGYLLSCQHFDGGFGWEAGTESHSGLTYCVVAALKMMNGLKQVRDYEGLVRYLSARCGEEGWNGRIGKIPDSCYTFWNIASLASLGFNVKQYVDEEVTDSFILSCQNGKGGFSKHIAGSWPDVVHTLYSLAALSFFGRHGLKGVDCLLAVPLK